MYKTKLTIFRGVNHICIWIKNYLTNCSNITKKDIYLIGIQIFNHYGLRYPKENSKIKNYGLDPTILIGSQNSLTFANIWN